MKKIKLLPQDPLPAGSCQRQVFQENKSQRQVVLHDHNGSIEFQAGSLHSAKVAVEEFKDHVTQSKDDGSSPVYMVAHIFDDRKGVMEGLFDDCENGTTRETIILEVSSTGTVDKKEAPVCGSFVWLSEKSQGAYKRVPDWLPQFLRLDFETAKAIAEATDRGVLSPKVQDDYNHLLDITHPGDPTASLAFRLLCEAWKECRPSDSIELHGMTIHAPTDLPSWLQSFGAKNISEVGRRIGHEEIGAKAEKVLRAVDENGDLVGPIEEFLSESANSKS